MTPEMMMIRYPSDISKAAKRIIHILVKSGNIWTVTLREFVNDVSISLKVPPSERRAFCFANVGILAALLEESEQVADSENKKATRCVCGESKWGIQ